MDILHPRRRRFLRFRIVDPNSRRAIDQEDACVYLAGDTFSLKKTARGYRVLESSEEINPFARLDNNALCLVSLHNDACFDPETVLVAEIVVADVLVLVELHPEVYHLEESWLERRNPWRITNTYNISVTSLTESESARFPTRF